MSTTFNAKISSEASEVVLNTTPTSPCTCLIAWSTFFLFVSECDILSVNKFPAFYATRNFVSVHKRPSLIFFFSHWKKNAYPLVTFHLISILIYFFVFPSTPHLPWGLPFRSTNWYFACIYMYRAYFMFRQYYNEIPKKRTSQCHSIWFGHFNIRNSLFVCSYDSYGYVRFFMLQFLTVR